MKIVSAAVLAALVLPGLAAAQEPSPTPAPTAQEGQRVLFHHGFGPGMGLGAWWKNSDIAKEVGVSDSQASQLEQTFLQHRLKLIDLRAELEKQELQLQSLIDADRLDESQVSAQLDQVLAARGGLEKEAAMMMVSVRRVLSPDQWKKLQSIQQKREPMFFKHFKHDGPIEGPMMFEHPLGAPPPPPEEP